MSPESFTAGAARLLGRRDVLRLVRQAGAEPVCLASLDLDNFKAFNDAHGHRAGDVVLRDAARAWKRLLRPSDVLARLSGEEFGLIFPARGLLGRTRRGGPSERSPIDQALAVVDRLRAATPGGVTVSTGHAAWRGGDSQEELLARADGALDKAKGRGGDHTATAS